MSGLRGNDGPRYRDVADGPVGYETITDDRLTPIIGARIGGVELRAPLANRVMDEIDRALAENCVIFFRDQRLTEQQHLAFGRDFGALHIHSAAPHAPGHSAGQASSVAFWHRAMWDYWPRTRAGFRVTVAGESPV